MTTKIFFTLACSLIMSAVMSQRVIDVDKYDGSALNFFRTVGGEPVMNTKFVRLVEGTPYFNENWLKGNVVIEESEYRNLLLRVNILETALEFRDTRGEAMVCTQPIKKVILKDSVKGLQYTFTHSSFLPENPDVKKMWLLQLADGKAGLYKLEKKQLNESRPYGSATTEQRITSINSIYVLFNNQLTRIKKTSDIPEILTSQKAALLDYIKSNRLSQKDEKDMVQLVNYFNTL